VALRQCFEHTGNQKADTCGLCERQDVCLPSWRGFLWRDCCVYIRGAGANFSKYWLYWLKGQCMVKIVHICAFKNCICADSFWTSFICIFCILCIFWDGKNCLRFFNKQPFLAFGIDFWNYFEKWQFLDKTGRRVNHGLEYGLACIQEANCCEECRRINSQLELWISFTGLMRLWYQYWRR
jgi:hypothetical protein